MSLHDYETAWAWQDYYDALRIDLDCKLDREPSEEEVEAAMEVELFGQTA